MKIRIKTDAQSNPILRRMAADAGVSIEKLAEIAVYNLIAIWVRENGVEGADEITHPPHDVTLPGGVDTHAATD